MSGLLNKSLIHLDCTLRDGGYYNNWHFDIALINDYLKAMSDAKIDIVEIGFRSLNKSSFKGPAAYSNDEFLNLLIVPKNIKIAVMINASELIDKGSFSEKNLNNLLLKKNKKTKIDVLRIASHLHEFELICRHSNLIKNLGYILVLNLMQCSELDRKKLDNVINLLKKSNIDVFYLADSLGCIDQKKLEFLFKTIKNKIHNLPLGFHAHDNLTLAHQNTLSSLNYGATWIDSTIYGMGRGPGNARTELLLPELNKDNKKKFTVLNIEKLISKYFLKLKEKYNWGTNYYYYKSAQNKIHPTFIQNIETDKRYTEEDKLNILEKLSQLKNANNFSNDFLNLINTNKIKIKKNYFSNISYLKKVFKKKNFKEILLIGAGPSINSYKKQIENFILSKKIPVCVLNAETPCDENLIHYRIACHPIRIMADKKKYEKIKSTIILPFDQINEKKVFFNKFKNKKKIVNIPLKVVDNTIKFKNGISIVPILLSTAYALTIFSTLNVKKISLIGFDGYEQVELNKNNNFVFNQFRINNKKIILESLTPTKYNIPHSNLFFY